MAKKEPTIIDNKKISIRANGTKRVQTINDLPSRTQKQYKDDVDVNKIMARYKKTGQINHLRNAAQGTYMDLTQIPDLLTARLQILQAESAFQNIPPELRLKFQNKPENLIAYLKDSKNHEEAIHLGLMVKRENDKPNDDTANQPKAPEASSSKS